MKRPLLLEGDAGVGKTEIARSGYKLRSLWVELPTSIALNKNVGKANGQPRWIYWKSAFQ
jgi:hypothetical protein